MNAVEPIEEDGAHSCLNGRRCVNKVDGKPRHTEQARAFCDACLSRTVQRIQQLPEQWLRLHAMIGDRQAGVDVNIRRPKPSGNVPLNLHVDTLLGDIVTTLTTAAEVIADKMGMDNPEHSQPAEQVLACTMILAPNLRMLVNATGVGGREEDDPAIDVMSWLPNGTFQLATTTTGVELVQKLDHHGSLAYFTLGLTRARIHRDIPCARCHAKQVGRWAGADDFDCEGCGARIPEEDVRRQDRVLIELHKRGLISKEAS